MKDITERLEDCGCCDSYEAAEEIERLRIERDRLRAELVSETNKLRAERDEARREVCMNEAKHLPTMADPHREAKRRGWDCFKGEAK